MFSSMIPCLKDVRGNCGDGGDVSGDDGGDGGDGDDGGDGGVDGKERMRVRESVEKVVEGPEQ